MAYFLLCLNVLCAAYALNAVMITVGYHRGLAHNSVELHPVTRRIVILTGNWITGLDPKAWAVMHRMHHAYSDTPRDPHSPVNVGIAGILQEQLKSYKRTITHLNAKDPKYTKFAHDLDFDLNWLNRSGLWWLPYAVHGTLAFIIGLAGMPLLGLCYFGGMMSHPLQGGLVNALGHAMGPRNFDMPDDSRNNHIVAWLVLGEGYQNNHHAYPNSPRFSFRAWEFDMGYTAAIVLEAVGALTINTEALIPDTASLLPHPLAYVLGEAFGAAAIGGTVVNKP